MRGLHKLVMQSKALYLGISDAPAWIVSKANQYARDHTLTPFVIYQGEWNVTKRSFEQDIIPMARSEGMALASWNVLCAGKVRTDAEKEQRGVTGEHGRKLIDPNWERNEAERKMCKELEQVAKEVGSARPFKLVSQILEGRATACSGFSPVVHSVAIAYPLQKTIYVFPHIGGRKVEHLMSNIEALKFTLSPEQVERIESKTPFEIGFPGDFVGTGDDFPRLMKSAAVMDKEPLVQPIKPATEPGAN